MSISEVEMKSLSWKTNTGFSAERMNRRDRAEMERQRREDERDRTMISKLKMKEEED